jgi:hypothetical protein
MGRNSRSRSRKRHYMEEDTFSLYKKIRKPMPPKGMVHVDRKEKRKKRFDWRDEIDDNI